MVAKFPTAVCEHWICCAIDIDVAYSDGVITRAERDAMYEMLCEEQGEDTARA